MKQLLILTTSLLVCLSLQAQTTVTFKPGPAAGQDALIFTTYGCHPSQYPSPPEQLNFGSDPELPYVDWTYDNQGCPNGTHRSLVRFNGLSTIPSGATITNATLRLYGVPSSSILPIHGNSQYSGSPFSLTNPGWVRRATNGWNENTVTWNTQPSSTTTNQVAIPVSTSQWNWNVSLNVTGIVQDIFSSGINNGFLLRLQTEGYYRSVLFASSDHSNSDLWPELEVTYTVCDASFTYCSSSDNPYLYTFSATTSGAGSYTWIVNGNPVGNGPVFQFPFPGPGTYQVCLRIEGREGSCERCILVCVAENEIIRQDSLYVAKTSFSKDKTIQINQAIPGDIVLNISSISPNPTKAGWKIKLQTLSGNAYITLFDLSGKVVKKRAMQLESGEDSFFLPSDQLAEGVYILKIEKGQLSLTKKLIKVK